MSSWNLEETQVLLYISNQKNNYDDLKSQALKALDSLQEASTSNAKQVVLYLLQNSEVVSSILFDQINELLIKYSENSDDLAAEATLELLQGCGKPKSCNVQLMKTLWKILESTENSAKAEQVSHILALFLPYFTTLSLEDCNWWNAIVSCITRTTDKRHVMAALRVWLTCVNRVEYHEYVRNVVETDGVTYFELLEPRVAEASKFAIQILESTFGLLKNPVHNHVMDYDPKDDNVRECWNRYLSLVEVLGVDTSVHQTMGSLSDFAALMGEKSPINPKWIVSLINVGLCISNTEGIRVLTMEMIMSLIPKQMRALTLFPDYVSQILFPRILQTPNFVVIYDTCIHADHFERFSRNLLKAYLESSTDNLQRFIGGLANYFMEHSHCFEAPRVLFTQAMLDILPVGSLPVELLNQLYIAAEATSITYNSKAMADLYLKLVKDLRKKLYLGNATSEEVNELDSLKTRARNEIKQNGYLTRESFISLKSNKIAYSQIYSDDLHSSPKSLMECTLALQASILDEVNYLMPDSVKQMLTEELNDPKPMKALEREKLSETVGYAFNFIDFSPFDLCEITFSAYSSVPTRLAALRAFKRNSPCIISLDGAQTLWNHLKDATLRFIDRELHHEFIDLITTPGAVSEAPESICIELVELSLRRRNLLAPMAIGLARHSTSPAPWVQVVMARVFAFMRSQEYTVRFEELLAIRYGIYEEKWGHSETLARAIAANFLKSHLTQEGADEVVKDTLHQAAFEKQITGSLDNPEAHLRVLYYQILILVQSMSNKDLALELLKTVTSSLEMEANPPVRVHAEWLVASIASTHIAGPDFNKFVLQKIDELDGSLGMPPRVLSSMIRICLLLYYIQFINGNNESELLGEAFVEHLLPLATSNKAVLRHRAISTLYILNQKDMTPKNFKSIVDTCARINTAAVLTSSHQNESYLWDITDTRLGPVCGGVCSLVFDRRMPHTLLQEDFDSIRKIDESLLNEKNVGPCWSSDQIVNKRRSELPLPDLIEAREKVVADAVKQGLTAEFSSSMQTKSGNFDVEYRARRTELIVVATLCDKPVNLGAICRLSDALGAKSMTIKDTSVLNDQHFKSTALTAEKWIPITQVSEQDLGEFLLEQKSQGYSLIGIEQTDTSKTLGPNLKFPKKTVLMMGHEKQGIPAELLALLDSCIEIEQLGYVRSMNIQTATAIVVHAYNHQHCEGIVKLE